MSIANPYNPNPTTVDSLLRRRQTRVDLGREQGLIPEAEPVQKSQPTKFFPKETTLYKGKGCNNCGNTGYKGRTAIFEFIQNSLQLQDLILKNPSTKQIWELVVQQGTHPLFYDGIEKVKSGVTTLEELLRVATPPKI